METIQLPSRRSDLGPGPATAQQSLHGESASGSCCEQLQPLGGAKRLEETAGKAES